MSAIRTGTITGIITGITTGITSGRTTGTSTTMIKTGPIAITKTGLINREEIGEKIPLIAVVKGKEAKVVVVKGKEGEQDINCLKF
jgi:hypothetical protein